MALLLLGGCGGGTETENVRTHFTELAGFDAHVKILSSLTQSVLEYEMDCAYNGEGSDTFALTAPASLAGIGGTIAGEDSEHFTLQFDGLTLDDAMPQRIGLTPADALFCLVSDLRTGEPVQQWTERAAGQTLLVLRYEGEDTDGPFAKQVFLAADTLQPVCAELYAGDRCVLTLQVTAYKER